MLFFVSNGVRQEVSLVGSFGLLVLACLGYVDIVTYIRCKPGLLWLPEKRMVKLKKPFVK